MRRKESTLDYAEKALKKVAEAPLKKTVKRTRKKSFKGRVKEAAVVLEKPKATVDVYLVRVNATIYSDEYIPVAIRVAELSRNPLAKDLPLSLSDEQLGRITVEPHVFVVSGKKEKMVKTPEGERHGVIDNALLWMIFKIPSEFNLNHDEVEGIIGLLRFGFGKYGTCKIEEFSYIGKNYEEEP